MNLLGHPILTCEAARDFEAKFFGGDETKEWSAMQAAGRSIAEAVLRDFAEIGGFSPRGRILVLAGKGHNGGDALIATQTLLENFPESRADVVFVFGERSLRPLAVRAWRALVHAAGGRVRSCRTGILSVGLDPAEHEQDAHATYELCLDGIFGFQFRPPAEVRVTKLIAAVNARPIRLRAAVDLPSAGLFRADFTYATGIVKSPVLDSPEAGRVRYLDVGFFESGNLALATEDRVLTAQVLSPLSAWRAPSSDKRTYGHVFIVGGSRGYPGAVLMTVLAALRSGVGLVTAFVPDSLVAAFAARAPEAMWVGWPETPDGSLALEGEHLLRTRVPRATALVIGPGLGREAETQALVTNLVKTSQIPVLLDADALQPEIVSAGEAPRVLTPHAGEWARIADGMELREFAAKIGAIVALKGGVTRVGGSAVLQPAGKTAARGLKHRATPEIVYHSFFGGPVLARGGSGDLLAGLIGGLLAQTPAEPLLATCRGVVWHGLAADALARAHGQTAVSITELLDFLPDALRSDCRAAL